LGPRIFVRPFRDPRLCATFDGPPWSIPLWDLSFVTPPWRTDHCGTPFVGPPCWNSLGGPDLWNPRCGTPLGVQSWGFHLGTHLVETPCGTPLGGTPLRDPSLRSFLLDPPLVYPRCATSRLTPAVGPPWGTVLKRPRAYPHCRTPLDILLRRPNLGVPPVPTLLWDPLWGSLGRPPVGDPPWGEIPGDPPWWTLRVIPV
jgi:hypothetical protein